MHDSPVLHALCMHMCRYFTISEQFFSCLSVNYVVLLQFLKYVFLIKFSANVWNFELTNIETQFLCFS